MWTIRVVDLEVTRLDDGTWSTGSDPALVELVENEPTAPMPVTVTGPMLAVSWSDERWVYLHVAAVLDGFGATWEAPNPPDFAGLVGVPDGAVP